MLATVNHKDLTAQQAVADTKILQKVNQAHREAFIQKFPGQCEHILRLTAERLQACLIKREGQDLGNPQTWTATASEIKDLALALNCLHEIHKDL
jgi:aminoglycoside phosphotransferase